jgi:hypothetical protein
MYTQPMILPINADGTLYVAQDERGECIGTGTREVCQALIDIVLRAKNAEPVKLSPTQTRANVRAAIVI